MTWFSASLLLNRIYEVKGRLAPGFCPYRAFPTIDQLGYVTSLIKDRLAENTIESNTEVSIVYGEEYPAYERSFQETSGHRDSIVSLDLYDLIV
jgi:hypothetical protein